MIEINDDNDPMMFCRTLPAGVLIFQFHEVAATLLEKMPADTAPALVDVVEAMRKSSRTPEVAAAATPAQLYATYLTVAQRVQNTGNG